MHISFEDLYRSVMLTSRYMEMYLPRANENCAGPGRDILDLIRV